MKKLVLLLLSIIIFVGCEDKAIVREKVKTMIRQTEYQKVVINSENKMQIEDEKGQYIPIERLSIGTIDQMYLALRLSMINEISSEKMPIILDETFAYFDEERLKNILTYLSIGLKNNQVIILTCSDRERKIMEELGQPYQYIELFK